MKKGLIFLIVVLIHGSDAFGCTCISSPIIEEVMNSHFVGIVEILEVNQDNDSTYAHTVRVQTKKIFKGTSITELKLENTIGTACGFYPGIGSDWLVFAWRDGENNYHFMLCFSNRPISWDFDKNKLAEGDERLERKMEVLEFLSKNKISPSNEFHIDCRFTSGWTDAFDGRRITGDRFAVFQLIVNPDLTPQRLKVVKGFQDESLTSEILRSMADNIELKQFSRYAKELADQTSLYIVLNYYPERRKSPSHFSVY